MANLDESAEQAKALREEFVLLESALASIGGKIKSNLTANFGRANDEAKDLVRSVGKDISASISNSTKLLDTQESLIKKINKGVNVEKELQKEIAKVQKNKATIQRKLSVLKLEGVILDEEQVKALEEQLGVQEDILNEMVGQNTEMQKSKSLTSLVGDSIGKFADGLDKSGTLSKLLKGNFSEVLTVSRLGELSMLAIGTAILAGSENMAMLSQETGMSKDQALALSKSLNQTAIDSENVAFTGAKAHKAFKGLTEQTGLTAEFGGQTLETFSMLTGKLHMAGDAASSLTMMARMQGKETEQIVADTAETAQNIANSAGVGINLKGVLNDVASTSNSIKVSLGSNPEALAEAAANAALLGTNLSGVDAIASSLLDFEQSIKNELAAEMLLGKDLNFEKARQLALNNDLVGLSEELLNNEELTSTFATGNRMQQEAAAAAIGMSRDAMADMVMKQQMNNLSAQEFNAINGEGAYERMQAVSAQEKLGLAMDKMKDSVSQIGLAFAPFIDGLAKGFSTLMEYKPVLVAIGALMAGLAARSAALAVINFASSVAQLFGGNAALGPPGIAIAIAGVAAMTAAVAGASSIMGTADDMIAPPGYGDRILSSPKGSIALNNQDTVVAGTNLGSNSGGNSSGDRSSMNETNALLNQILNKQGTVKMNATSVGTAFSVNSRQIQ
tara:strand:+ start:1071 stop:3098 length:2028 start_codon:yes stop_codon:yes gene_type:complete